MKKLNYLLVMVMSLAFVACNDEEAVVDTQKPDISLQAPTGQGEVFADEQVNVRANITDNLGLQTVTISVTPPGGTAQVVHTEEVRNFLNDNKRAELNKDVSLGTAGTTPAAGNYTITVRAVDVRGNEATQAVSISVIEADNEGPTVAAITSPTADAEFVRGSDIVLATNVQDNKNIKAVRVTITSGETVWYNETFEEDELGDDPMMFTLNETVTIPADAPIGTHTLRIEADDMRGNTSTAQTVNFTVAQEAGE